MNRRIFLKFLGLIPTVPTAALEVLAKAAPETVGLFWPKGLGKAPIKEEDLRDVIGQIWSDSGRDWIQDLPPIHVYPTAFGDISVIEKRVESGNR